MSYTTDEPVNKENMRFGSVCSGIEAASVAWEPLGWSAAWFAEIEAFPSSVLAHRFPAVPNLGDMTAIAAAVRAGFVEAPDVLVGGTPCQAFSVAGVRAGLADPRGQLTLSYADLLNAIDEQRPGNECIAVWENVPGVLSDKTNAFGCFLGILAGESVELVSPGGSWPNAGIVHGPQRSIAWRVLDAQFFGVAQRRRRVFVVASARNGFDPAAILFESDGVRRDTAPRRQAGQDVTGTLSSRTSGGGGLGTDFDVAGGCQPVKSGVAFAIQAGALRENPESGPDGMGIKSDVAYTLEARTEVQCVAAVSVAPTLRAGGNSTGVDRPPGTDVDTCDSLLYIAPTLRGDDATYAGPERREDDSDVPVVVSSNAEGATGLPFLTCSNLAKGVNNQTPLIGSYRTAGDGAAYDSGDRTAALTTGTDPCANVVAFSCKDYGNDAQVDFTPTMRSMGHNASHQNGGGQLAIVAQGWQVRRLTPTECERLQGFPDGWTAVSHRNKPAADGPRYKSLGNSMAVPCMAWIGRRLLRYTTDEPVNIYPVGNYANPT